MMNVKKVGLYFRMLGFETDDIQADEPSVGISTGWVLFRKPNKKWREIAYNDAVYLMNQLSGKTEILKNSVINKELNE